MVQFFKYTCLCCGSRVCADALRRNHRPDVFLFTFGGRAPNSKKGIARYELVDPPGDYGVFWDRRLNNVLFRLDNGDMGLCENDLNRKIEDFEDDNLDEVEEDVDNVHAAILEDEEDMHAACIEEEKTSDSIEEEIEEEDVEEEDVEEEDVEDVEDMEEEDGGSVFDGDGLLGIRGKLRRRFLEEEGLDEDEEEDEEDEDIEE